MVLNEKAYSLRCEDPLPQKLAGTADLRPGSFYVDNVGVVGIIFIPYDVSV